MAKRKLYETLGVAADATEQEIRKAYRDLARKLHPDRNPGNKQAEERFKDIGYASEILLNKQKRALYDEFGEMGLREGFQPDAYRDWSRRRQDRVDFGGASGGGFGGFEDLFDQVRSAARRGGAAGGGGMGDFFSGDFEAAGKRRGKRKRPDAIADITIDFMEAVLGTEKELILEGGGEARTLRVRIPAGVRDEGQVRLREQGPGGADLMLRVRVKEHPVFKRTEDDLELSLPITVGEAYHGAKVQVPTPYGPVTLRIPKGARSGSSLRLKGKGVMRGAEAGDLFARLQIVLPDSEEAAPTVDALEALYSKPVRSELEPS